MKRNGLVNDNAQSGNASLTAGQEKALSTIAGFYSDMEAQKNAHENGAFGIDIDREMNDLEVKAAMEELFPRRVSDLWNSRVDNGEVAATSVAMDANAGPAQPPNGIGGMGGGIGLPPRSIARYPGGIGPIPRSAGNPEPISNPAFDPISRYGINEKVLRHFWKNGFIDWNACALINTNPIVATCCEMPGADAISHGYRLKCISFAHKQGDEHVEAEAEWLEALKRESDEMGINKVCSDLDNNKRVFGVGLAFPILRFKDEAVSPSDKTVKFSYADPYDPTMVEPNSYEGFVVIDPNFLTFEFDEDSTVNPMSKHFQEPTWYVNAMTGVKVHRSWVIRCVHVEVPEILKPVYRYGGLPLTQMLYHRVWCADMLADEGPKLAKTKRLLVVDGNTEQMVNKPHESNHFFKMMNWFRDNLSVFVKKPQQNVTQIETSLADLAPLTAQGYQLVAAIAKIPVTKLMKNVPTGLQATGQYEQDDYSESLKTIQNTEYRPLLHKHYELLLHSAYPKRTDLRLDVEFNPIDVPKEEEVVRISSSLASMVNQLYGNGIVTVGEARSILRTSPHCTFEPLAAETPALLKKIQEMKDPEKQQQMQGQMNGGMGGGMMPGAGGGNMPPDPSVEANKTVFQNALKSVLGTGTGGGDKDAGQGQGAEGENAAPGGEGEGGGENAAAGAAEAPQGAGEASGAEQGPFAAALAQIDAKKGDEENPVQEKQEG